MISNEFQEWACSLSGCDGGNIHADVWLCGIEWGGASQSNYYERLSSEIQMGAVASETEAFNWAESVTYSYGRNFAKLFCAMNGGKVEDFKEKIHTQQWDGSELFKLNLYPIAFDSTDHNLWHQHDLHKITGFQEKFLFQTWCSMNRFPAFSKLMEKHAPRIVIGTGVSYLRDFFTCFGGSQINSQFIEIGELSRVSQANQRYKRRYYWVKINNRTTLVVIPFLSGPAGLNSNALLQEMGEKIQKISK